MGHVGQAASAPRRSSRQPQRLSPRTQEGPRQGRAGPGERAQPPLQARMSPWLGLCSSARRGAARGASGLARKIPPLWAALRRLPPTASSPLPLLPPALPPHPTPPEAQAYASHLTPHTSHLTPHTPHLTPVQVELASLTHQLPRLVRSRGPSGRRDGPLGGASAALGCALGLPGLGGPAAAAAAGGGGGGGGVVTRVVSARQRGSSGAGEAGSVKADALRGGQG
jgi:hypothetical protein